MESYISKSEEETKEIGRVIAERLPVDVVIHLRGDLGAGKTALVRAIAAARGADPLEVASPSFAIIHEYPVSGGLPIIHVDGYRLSDRKREWLEIGIDEVLKAPGLKLIEWPKEAFADYEQGHIDITVTVRDDDSREIVVNE